MEICPVEEHKQKWKVQPVLTVGRSFQEEGVSSQSDLFENKIGCLVRQSTLFLEVISISCTACNAE